MFFSDILGEKLTTHQLRGWRKLRGVEHPGASLAQLGGSAGQDTTLKVQTKEESTFRMGDDATAA